MSAPTVERPRPGAPMRREFLPQTRIGWWALALQLLTVALAAGWAPLGRALGHLQWGAWGLVPPVAVAALVVATGSVAVFRAKDRSVLLLTLFALTTAAFVLVGLALLGLAVGKPDMNPSQ